MAQIKKISTELQLLDKLLDTSGDAGTSGQLLSSTGTGTNWITFSGVTASNGSSGRAAFFTGSTTIEGSDNFYWDNSNARLGIGTSSPAVTLHVSGFARANALQLTNANAQIYNISNSSLRLGTNNTERMRIDASGNVGIGTTSPSNTLDVNGGAEFNAETYIRSQSNVGLRVQTIDQGIGGSDGLRVGLNGTHAFVWNYENTPLSFGTNGSQKATILANGNVGIGTTSPSTKLHVRNGEATIASDTDGVKLSYSNGNSSGIIDTAFSDNNLEFRTNGTAKMWIANAGNVGIGTTNPQTKLHVEGITRVTESSNTAFYGGDYVRVFGNQYYSFRNTGGSTIAQIHMNGNSYFNGGNVGIGTTSPSDGDLTINAPKLHVVGPGTGGTYNLAARFQAGNDSDNTGSAILINHSNDRGLLIKAGRKDGDREVAYFDVISSGGNITNMLTMGKFGSDYNVGIGTTAPNRQLHVIGQFAIDNSTSPTAGILISPDSNSNKIYSRIANNSSTPNHLDFISGSSTSMRIDTNGRVGIGTTSPEEELHVNGNIKAANIYGQRHTSGSITNGNYYRIIELNGGTGRGKCSFTLSSGGGSGTPFLLKGFVNAAWSNNGSTLTVSFNSKYSSVEELRVVRNADSGKSYVDVKMSGEDNVVIDIQPLSASNAIAVDFTDVTTLPSGDTVETTVDVHDKAFATGSDTGTSATGQFNITHAGNVGIGTTSPGGKVEIKGDTNENVQLRLQTDGNASEVPTILFRRNSSAYGEIKYIPDGGGNQGIHITDYRTDASNIIFNTAGSNERMRITSGGNVGIGTTSPVTKLNVVGNVSVSATKAYRMYNAANNAWGEMSFVEADNRIQFNRGIQNSGTDFRLSEDTNASFVCANEGNLGIGTTSPAVKLDVNGVLNLQGGTWNGGGSESDHTIVAAAITEGHFIFTKDGDNLRRLIGKTSDIIEIGQSGTALIDGISFKSGSTPLYRWYNDTSEIMRLNDLGLGIGTTLPVNPLHVEGDFTLRGNQYMGDDEKLTLGLGEDLEIYHNASNSIIENNTGDLILKNNANDKDIIFQSDDGSGGTATYFLLDGSIGPGTGSTFTRFPDNSRAVFGTASDLQIYHDGTHSYITENNSGGSLIVRGSNFAVQSSDGTDDFITTVADQGVNLFYNDVKKFETTSTGATVTGYLTVTDSLLATNAVVIGTAGTPEQVAIFEGSTNEMWFQQGTSGGTVRYQTDNFIINGHNGNETQFTSTKDGSVDLYYDNSKKFETTSDGVLVSGFLESKKADTGAGYNDGIARFVNNTSATSGGSAVINVRNTYGIGFGGLIKFWSTSTATSVGNISFNSSRTAVNYNTGSDYRLKEDYKDFNALDLTSKIKVYDFKWKNVNDRSYGVIAHELNEIVPSVVSGDKDGEEMQSVDYSKLVPVLIKSIQELEARLAALEN